MEDTIILAIEKLSRVCRFLLWDSGKKYGLTPLQIQVMGYLKQFHVDSASITQISKDFDMSKPTITEAVHCLEKKRLVYRIISPHDKRRYSIFLSPRGKKREEKLSSWSNGVKEQLKKFPHEVKENTLLFLMELIASLKDTGIIQIAKTCISCENFIHAVDPEKPQSHFCRFRDVPVNNSQLRMNCERFTEKILKIPDQVLRA